MGRAHGGPGRAAGGRRGKYTEESLREQLEAFTAGRDDWPTSEELRRAGRNDLVYAISITGGAAYWAKLLGKRLGRYQTKRRRSWTHDEIERQLREFIGRGEVFPSQETFVAAERYDLYMAVRNHGGLVFWRQQLGLPPSRRNVWTDDELEAALREFLGDRPDWPTGQEFRAAGRNALIVAVRNRGGVIPWATRLGKTLSERQRVQAERK